MITFLTLKAEDCFSYRKLEFDFATGLHSVTGENGSSKTSIFLTLQQGLYNRNQKNCKVAEVSNSITKKPYHIEVTFRKGDDLYTIVNSKKTESVTLHKNGRDLSLKRIPDTLKLIAEVLGCDYEMFCDLTYQSKSSTLNLLDATTNKGRAEFVNRILRLDELDFHLNRLEGIRKSLEGKNGTIAGLREQLRLLEASLAETQEVGEELPEIDSTETKRELDEVLKRATEVAVDISSVKRSLSMVEQAEAANKKRSTLEAKLQAIVLPQDTQEVIELVLKSLQQSHSTKSAQLRQTKAEYDRLKGAQERGVCYACGQGVEPCAFTAEINQLRGTGAMLKVELEDIKRTTEGYEAQLAVWKQYNSLATELHRLGPPPPEVEAEPLKIVLAGLSGEQVYLGEKKQELEQQLAKASRIREHNAALRAQIQMNRKIEEINRQNRLLLDQKKKELEEAEGRVDLLKTWAGILGATGYRTARIARFLQSLNQIANRYARMICRGRIVCRFHLDAKGEINFAITDDAKTQDITLWSGGETARIKVVCLFALLELLQTVGSVSFNVLCLDEVFDALDAEGKEGLFAVLDYLRNRNKAIYTIAHSELALDLVYDSVIRAEKLADGTTRILQ